MINRIVVCARGCVSLGAGRHPGRDGGGRGGAVDARGGRGGARAALRPMVRRRREEPQPRRAVDIISVVAHSISARHIHGHTIRMSFFVLFYYDQPRLAARPMGP